MDDDIGEVHFAVLAVGREPPDRATKGRAECTRHYRRPTRPWTCHDPIVVTLIALAVVLAGVGAFAVLAARGAGHVVRGWPGRSLEGQQMMAIGIARLAGACCLVGVVAVAGPVAESRTGWEDLDGNGMLDPFANGAYDWVDVNLGEAVRVLGALVFGVLMLIWGALRAVDPRPAGAVCRREQVARFWARH